MKDLVKNVRCILLSGISNIYNKFQYYLAAYMYHITLKNVVWGINQSNYEVYV